MKKQLSEMTLEELWQLFPIQLTKHQPVWAIWYETEFRRLQKILPIADITRISHIGSTSIDTIWAKPIIDILVETKQDCSWDILKDLLHGGGYICMSETNKRLSFNKGYTIDGFAKEVFHLHLRYSGDNDELYFRDYLKEFPKTAKAYENLKVDLWHKHEHNRDAYTNGKTNFVKKYTEKAKVLYGNRYI